MWRAVADQSGVAVVRSVDIAPSVGQGIEIAQGKGLEAVVCGAELRVQRRRCS
jgi:hypothetical protein